MGHDGTRMSTYRCGLRSFWSEPAPQVRRLLLKITNEKHIVTLYYSAWKPRLSCLLSLRPALFAAGTGEVRFRDFHYRALR